MRSDAWPLPPSDLMKSVTRSLRPSFCRSSYSPTTSLLQTAPPGEFQYVIRLCRVSFSIRATTCWVSPNSVGGLLMGTFRRLGPGFFSQLLRRYERLVQSLLTLLVRPESLLQHGNFVPLAVSLLDQLIQPLGASF